MKKSLFLIKLIIVSIILSIVLFFFFTVYKKSISKNIPFYERLSEKDKNQLDFFFKSSFDDTFAYVLFGNKPLALSGYSTFTLREKNKIKPFYKLLYSLYEAYHPTTQKMKKGMETIKKHSSSLSNFIIKEEVNPWNEEYIFILLINRDSFIRKFNEHSNDFKKVLGENVSAKNLLNRCIKGENLLKDVLKSHNGLIGTLLGYGRNNAWQYHRRYKLLKKIDNSSITTKEKEEFDKINFDSFEDTEFIEKFENFTKKTPFSSNHEKYLDQLPFLMKLPEFMSDFNDPETKKLIHIYSQNRKDIIKLYDNQDFLKVTIERLFSSEY